MIQNVDAKPMRGGGYLRRSSTKRYMPVGMKHNAAKVICQITFDTDTI